MRAADGPRRPIPNQVTPRPVRRMLRNGISDDQRSGQDQARGHRLALAASGQGRGRTRNCQCKHRTGRGTGLADNGRPEPQSPAAHVIAGPLTLDKGLNGTRMVVGRDCVTQPSRRAGYGRAQDMTWRPTRIRNGLCWASVGKEARGTNN